MDPTTRFAPAVDYAIGLLGDDRGEEMRRLIAYGDPDEPGTRGARVCIVPSGFFGPAYGRPESLTAPPLPLLDGVPLLFGRPRTERRPDGRLVTQADIVASAFFLATRYEEVVRRDARDAHGRFPGRESLGYRCGFIARPIVDEYSAILRGWMRAAGVDVPERRRRFSVLLTHDVDFPWTRRGPVATIRAFGRWFAGRGSLRNAWETPAIWLRLARDPLDTFAEMIAMDRRLQESAIPTSVVYFLKIGGQRPHDFVYRLDSRAGRTLLHKLAQSGADFGLHASYDAGDRPALIAKERKRLEQVCGVSIARNRHHYLRWREVEDGARIAGAGIRWDSTLGYPDVAGFRLGTCRPIPLFDPTSLTPMGIEEHPLMAMDVTFSTPQYMALPRDEAVAYGRGLIDATRRHAGEFTMLWHNNSFAGAGGDYHRGLYRALLEELRAGGGQAHEAAGLTSCP